MRSADWLQKISRPKPPPAASAAVPVTQTVTQAALDEALGEFLRSDEELRRLNRREFSRRWRQALELAGNESKALDKGAWMRAQGDYARAVLDSIPGRAALLKRITELENATPARVVGSR